MPTMRAVTERRSSARSLSTLARWARALTRFRQLLQFLSNLPRVWLFSPNQPLPQFGTGPTRAPLTRPRRRGHLLLRPRINLSLTKPRYRFYGTDAQMTCPAFTDRQLPAPADATPST